MKKVKKANCFICGRGPSIAGNEPLYLIPSNIYDSKKDPQAGLDHDISEFCTKESVFYCGQHFEQLMKEAHKSFSDHTDFSNLITYNEIYLIKRAKTQWQQYDIVVQ